MERISGAVWLVQSSTDWFALEGLVTGLEHVTSPTAVSPDNSSAMVA